MPGLNLDVLCLVSSFITDVPDVLAFSLTCSTLRSPAIYRRLSMRPVTITSGTSINTLHDFIFVDKAARGPHIHAITIPQEATPLLQGSPEELLRRLLTILSAASRVHTLSICLPARISSSPLASPLIVPAIARLTGIQHLTLVAPFERANALLRCIRSPIKVFRYGSLYKDLYPHSNANLIGSSTRLSAIHRRMAMRLEMDEEGLTLEDVASHLSRTLCHLELPHLCLPRRAFQQVQPGPFLAVRSLVLRDITEIVRLDVILHILPNLDGVLIAEASPLFYKCVRDREHVEGVREANQLAQERHTWKKLDRVVSTPLMLYTLGLTCPIHHLVLDLSPCGGSLLERSDALVQHARWAVLRDHTPTHLTVRGLHFPAGLAHLDDLFSGDWALAPTTHVVVDAEYNSVDDDGKLLWPDDVLETLLARIEYPRLTHVHIVTSGLISDADAFSASVHHGIRDLSLERLATQFQHAVPSLTHIFLTSRGVMLQSDKKLQEHGECLPKSRLGDTSRS
ncbi:hypothetical protein V8D89_009906 [Ganoderma adspersum]